MENTKQKLPFRVKFAFGAGNIYSGAINTYNFFYAFFMTDIIGLNAIYASSVVLITQIWDAVTDPLMGFLSDHTFSRQGRRRVYFWAGIIPIFVSFVILWLPLRLSVQWKKYLFVLIGCLLFRTVYTMIMIPYQAMKAELSMDYRERSSVNLYCMLFAAAASIVSLLVPMGLTGAFAREPRKAYIILALGLGLFFTLPWIAVYRATEGQDRFTPVKKQKVSLREIFQAFIRPFRIWSFRVLAGVYLSVYIALDLMAMTIVYFISYCLPMGPEDLIGRLIPPILIAFSAQLITIPIMLHLSGKWGKAPAFLIGAVFWACGLVLLFGLQPGASFAYLSFLAFMIVSGLSAVILMLGSMQADLTDVGELYSGHREEGAFSGLYLFLRKTASAFTHAGLLFWLGMAGYTRPSEQIVNGLYQPIQQPQPEGVYTAIRLSISIIPAILVLVAIVLASQYTLDARSHDKLNQCLEKRRGGQHPDPYSLARLYRSLIVMRSSFSFRIFKLFVRIVVPHFTVRGAENIRRKAPCVMVANHLGFMGPIVSQLYFPVRNRPWAIDYTTEARLCYRHMRDQFYGKTLKFPPPFNIIMAALTTFPCLWMMKGARVISVHRGGRQIRKTFTESIHTLLGGESIALFPENHECPPIDGVKPFYPGFTHLGALHARFGRKPLDFYPVYIDKKNKVIYIGHPVVYRTDVDYAEETRRVASILEEEMRRLAQDRIQKTA
jgi:oligogalacturonide transporter